MKPIIIILLLLTTLLLIAGCTTPLQQTDYNPQIQNLQNQINEQKTKLEDINSKVTNIEANQLTSNDMINLFDLKAKEFDLEDYDLQGSCPSLEDTEFWWEQYEEGFISLSKYNKILKLYNECDN